jgi:hypothetical protein
MKSEKIFCPDWCQLKYTEKNCHYNCENENKYRKPQQDNRFDAMITTTPKALKLYKDIDQSD